MAITYETLPQRIPDEDGLEVIREIAYELLNNWEHHEVAIANPFQAESYVRRAGELLTALVGWPKGFVMGTLDTGDLQDAE